jgi:nicotinamide phosphoribosyltransferase
MSLSQTDSYKLSHKGFMAAKTNLIYSNLTARSSHHLNVIKDSFDNKAVFFGLQGFIMEFLIKDLNDHFFKKAKDKAIRKFKRLVDGYLGAGAVDMAHFEALHDLGYLPIEIKALPEGSRVNIKVPFLTIKNTHEDYAWLTNYLETVMSCELWKQITIATIIYEYRKMVNEYALKTTGSLDFTMFQLHDFSFRGMSGRQDAAKCGAAFLLSSCGTDTIPAVEYLEDYYNADVTNEFIATSVPASEHSIMCAGIATEGEAESVKRFITESYPTGIVSIVGDTKDWWNFLTNIICGLKKEILARPANAIGLSKVVARPDSGDPADIICGFEYFDPKDSSNEQAICCGALAGGYEVYKFKNKYYFSKNSKEVSEAEVKGSVELLWETFGGTVTKQGYKVLDSHIGLIYGDSITPAVALDVFQRLEAKGFASTNIVFGVGSYTMQYVTRDSLGMAVKATYTEVDHVGYELFKDPITDSGMKKSAKGLLRVEKEGDDFVLYDQQTWEQEQEGELQTVFFNGQLVRETNLSTIRSQLWG